ncbi:unnamed protein product [Knipowitschia caucasica]|uniref:Cytoskeleton-associated protein 4 n=1 Tax=Knipowitschia caucasica TaxID=637954 RepID=A0AAV2IY38_KNICA
MTAKNRNKNSAAEKSPVPSQEDVPKKNQKTSSNGTTSLPSQGQGSGNCLGFFASAVFYVTLLGAAGFAAFYFQQIVEEIRQTSAVREESALQNAELISKMQTLVQQVENIQRVVDGLESSLGITRGEMEGAISRMKRGEVETRKMEEALHKLQKDLLRDLSQGMAEVKEENKRDFSSLEQAVEERLTEASQSLEASFREFTEAQEDTKTQLSQLKIQMEGIEDPALVKQELSEIVDTVVEIRTAKQEADASVDSLRQQIISVREELQTRNQEVASLSKEFESVRTSVQENMGRLRQSLSDAEVSVQAVKDNSVTIETQVGQTAQAVRDVESKLVEAAAQTLKKSDELESRVKSSEESSDSLSSSLSDLTSKVESLLSKCDTYDSTMAAQGQTVEQAKAIMQQELEAIKSALSELQSSVTDVSNQVLLFSQDSSLSVQVEDLGRRLEDVERSSAGSVRPEQLESLESLVSNLEGKAAKLEGHENAISALQETLQKTTQTLAGLSKAPKASK